MSRGIKIVYNRLPELARRFPVEIGLIVKDTALEVEATAKKSMAEEKSGRVYVHGDIGHQASAPGEAPAIDTGNLVSLHTKMTSQTSAIVGTNAEYAAALEFGRADGHIAARPFLRPAARKAREHFINRLKMLEGRLR